jgi:hypothetical protein
MKGIGKALLILLGGLLLLPSMCIPFLAMSFVTSLWKRSLGDLVPFGGLLVLLVLLCVAGVALIRRALRPEQPKGPPP